MKKFPVFSLMIREFDAESSSQQTASSAMQSAIFSLSAERSKMESRVVMLAYENGLVSKIGSGENGGREITYDYTVRKLLPAFELDPAQRASVSKEITIDLDPSWSLNHLGVAAFIQDPTSLRIEGASSEYPVARN